MILVVLRWPSDYLLGKSYTSPRYICCILSTCICIFSFGFEGRILALIIVLVPGLALILPRGVCRPKWKKHVQNDTGQQSLSEEA